MVVFDRAPVDNPHHFPDPDPLRDTSEFFTCLNTVSVGSCFDVFRILILSLCKYLSVCLSFTAYTLLYSE